MSLIHEALKEAQKEREREARAQKLNAKLKPGWFGQKRKWVKHVAAAKFVLRLVASIALAVGLITVIAMGIRFGKALSLWYLATSAVSIVALVLLTGAHKKLRKPRAAAPVIIGPMPAPSPTPGRRGINGTKIMFAGFVAIGVALVAIVIVFGYIGIKGVGNKKPAAPVATAPKPKQAQPQVATAPKGTLRPDTAVQASGVSPTPAPAARTTAASDLVTKRGLPIKLVDLASGEPFGVRYGEAVGVIIPFQTSACIWVVEHGKKISGGREKYRRDSLLTTDGMLYYFETPAGSEKPVTIVIEKAIKVKKAANAH